MGTIINGIGITPWKGRSLRIGDMPDLGPRGYYEEILPGNWKMYTKLTREADPNLWIFSCDCDKKYLETNTYGWDSDKYPFKRQGYEWSMRYDEEKRQNQTSLLTVDMLFPDGEKYKCPDVVKEMGFLSFNEIIFTLTCSISQEAQTALSNREINRITLMGWGDETGPAVRLEYLAPSIITISYKDISTGNWRDGSIIRIEKNIERLCTYRVTLFDEFSPANIDIKLQIDYKDSQYYDTYTWSIPRYTDIRFNRFFIGNGLTENDIPMESPNIVGFWGIIYTFIYVEPISWNTNLR